MASPSHPFAIRHARGADLDDGEHERWLASAIRQMPELKLAELFRLKPDQLRECDHVVTATDSDGEFAGVVAARWFALCQLPSGALAASPLVVAPRPGTRDPFGDWPEGFGGNTQFLQLAISLIQSRHQRSPLLRMLWRAAFQAVVAGPRPFPAVIALRTYNPAAFQAMRAFALIPGVEIYPRIDGDQDPSMLRLAAAVADHLGGTSRFDPHTGVLERAGVPLDFYAALPEGGRENVRSYLLAHLAPGDRLLCILRAAEQATRQRICDAFGLHTRPATTKEEEPHV